LLCAQRARVGGGIQIGCTAVEPCIILVDGNQGHPHARYLMSLHILRHPRRRRHHSPDNHTTQPTHTAPRPPRNVTAKHPGQPSPAEWLHFSRLRRGLVQHHRDRLALPFTVRVGAALSSRHHPRAGSAAWIPRLVVSFASQEPVHCCSIRRATPLSSSSTCSQSLPSIPKSALCLVHNFTSPTAKRPR
jgi:hypothetical protein